MGGHQEGYTRPPYPGDKKIYIDQEVIDGKGLMYTLWGTNPFQTTLNAEQHRLVLHKRANIVKEAIARARGASTEQLVDVIYDACKNKGGMFVAAINLYPTTIAEEAHLHAAGRPSGRDEPHFDERRTPAAAVREVHGPARFRQARLPDRGRHRQHAEGAVPRATARPTWPSASTASSGRPRRMRSTTASAAPAGRALRRSTARVATPDYLATYALLRKAGNNGVQLPIKEVKDGKLIGTEMLYTDGKFDTKDGKAEFKPAPWNGLPQPVADAEGEAQVLDQQRPRPTKSGRRPITTSTTASCATATRWPTSR